MSDTTCPKCSGKGYFRYSIGFNYKIYVDDKKRKKRVVYIPDKITCLNCEFQWDVKE